MAGSSQLGADDGGPGNMSQEKAEDGGRWYFSRKEIEENSPSRRDGIDLKKETYLRKAYCTFLQDLGMRLKVPQVTIATAIIFCHRFYLRQSHSKNDRRTIATACMFLAGKVEETPRPLKDVILVSYEINHKKDPAAIQRIKQKDVYEQQKELILLAERVVLATLGFDLNVQHPYKPLVEAIKKFKVAQNALAQVAWNFVNDGLRTSLCLQFKPHHIAAGAIFLAAKFLKVKLPSDGEKVWWQEFEVTPRQLEEVSNQMLELYEQNRAPASQAQNGEADGSTAAGVASQTVSKASTEEHSQGGGNNKPVSLKPPVAHHVPDYEDNHGIALRGTHNRSTDYGSSGLNEQGHRENGDCKVDPPFYQDDGGDGKKVRSGSSWHEDDDEERNVGGSRIRESGELKDKYHGRSMDGKESAGIQSPPDVIKIGEDKLKELREKRKKSRGELVRKKDCLEEYDPIVKELEEGVELAAAESEKTKQEKQLTWSQHSVKLENDSRPRGMGQEVHGLNVENVEEGEVSTLDDASWGYQSPRLNERKRKAGSTPEKTIGGKQWPGSVRSYQHEYPEDRNKAGRFDYSDKDNKRHMQENHV